MKNENTLTKIQIPMDRCLINIISLGLEKGYWFEYDKTNYVFISPNRVPDADVKMITKVMGPIYIALHPEEIFGDMQTMVVQNKDWIFLEHIYYAINRGFKIKNGKTKNNFILEPRYKTDPTEIYELGNLKFKIPTKFWEYEYFDVGTATMID